MFMEQLAGCSWNRWPDDVEYAAPAPRALIPSHLIELEGEAALAAIVGPLAVIEYHVEDVAPAEPRPPPNPANSENPADGRTHTGAASDACRHCGERISWQTDGVAFADGRAAHNRCYERAALKGPVF